MKVRNGLRTWRDRGSDLSFCPPTDLEQRLPGAPGVFLAPHQGGLELVELLRPELLPAEDEADDVLRQLSEGAEAQHGVPVAVNEHQHLQENRRIYIYIYTFVSTFCMRSLVHLYCMYLSAEERREQTVSTVTQVSMKPRHTSFSSSRP